MGQIAYDHKCYLEMITIDIRMENIQYFPYLLSFVWMILRFLVKMNVSLSPIKYFPFTMIIQHALKQQRCVSY